MKINLQILILICCIFLPGYDGQQMDPNHKWDWCGFSLGEWNSYPSIPCLEQGYW